METREYKEVGIIPVKITITPAGVVTVENKKTDADYKRIVGFSVMYNDTTNLVGSTINPRFGGKPVFKQGVDTSLFVFNTSCPVNDRYFNYVDIPVNSSLIEVDYVPGSAFPVGNTVVTVVLQCSKFAADV